MEHPQLRRNSATSCSCSLFLSSGLSRKRYSLLIQSYIDPNPTTWAKQQLGLVMSIVISNQILCARNKRAVVKSNKAGYNPKLGSLLRNGARYLATERTVILIPNIGGNAELDLATHSINWTVPSVYRLIKLKRKEVPTYLRYPRCTKASLQLEVELLPTYIIAQAGRYMSSYWKCHIQQGSVGCSLVA